MNKSKRHIYLDILNIGACLCVLFMHCNGIAHTYTNTRAWKESMVVETLAYWAVPIFFMISGATLMRYREKYDTRTFFKKRLVKTVVPFLIWSVIMLLFKSLNDIQHFKLSPMSLIDIIMNNRAEQIYWFFIPLFMIYLSIPVLSLLKDNKRALVYMVGIAFITYGLYPVACRLLHIPPNASVMFPLVGGYLLYPLLGYLLADTELARKKRILLYLLGAAGILIRYIPTVVWSVKSGQLNQTFWGYLDFPCILLAVAVFVAAKQLPWEKVFGGSWAQKIIRALSSASFGVYLLHMIVFYYLQEYTGLLPTSYIWRFGIPFVLYAICVIVVLLLKKIPVVKYIVP